MSTTDLALFGGRAEFPGPLHVGRPNVGDVDHFVGLVRDILATGWLTNDGPYVQAFERRVAELAGTRHCIATSSGTTALELAYHAVGFAGEVILPAFTFVATAHAALRQGARPVFCDIDPGTHHIDPAAVETLITADTSGIIGVHLWGRPCATEALAEIADRHGLPLVFDASHALGVARGGRRVGTSGACEVFSFHATKFVNTLEGGAVVTDDSALAEDLRFMRNHGFCGEDRVTHLGTNAKMNEISAAMGLTLLDDADSIVAKNEAAYRAYAREFADVPGLQVLTYPEDGQYNYQHVVVMVDEAAAGLRRDDFVAVLRAENVLARRYFFPGCHRLQPYASMAEYAQIDLPATDDVAARVLVMPTGPQLQPGDVARIGAILWRAVDSALRVAREVERAGLVHRA